MTEKPIVTFDGEDWIYTFPAELDRGLSEPMVIRANKAYWEAWFEMNKRINARVRAEKQAGVRR